MEHILFGIFSVLVLTCAIFVITAKNPIHSVLFLVLVFFNVASLLIFLGVDFLALLFLIVYIGAVAVLFLFIIMMLSVKIPEFKTIMYQYVPIGALLGASFLCEALVIMDHELAGLQLSPYFAIHFNLFSFNSTVSWVTQVNLNQNIKVIASVLYTDYALLFILAGIILLVAMIGAIMLTLHRRCDTKRQDIFKQMQQDFDIAISWRK
jgi:NADH-quinone oxidoreductase subunit J